MENRFNGTLHIAWTPSVLRFLANVYYGDDGSSSTSEKSHPACSRSSYSHDRDSVAAGSGSEGLRPVMRALGQFTELLRAARAAGQLDPTVPGTVALFDVDSVDEDDQGNHDYALKRSSRNAAGGDHASGVDRQQCWAAGWVKLVVRPLIMLDGDYSGLQNSSKGSEGDSDHLSSDYGVITTASSPSSPSIPTKADPKAVSTKASNKQVCEDCDANLPHSLQQPQHRAGTVHSTNQEQSQQKAFQQEHQYQAQRSSDQALHHHQDHASAQASEVESDVNTAEAWAWDLMKYAAWLLAACFAAFMVQALFLAPLLAALQWAVTASVATLVVVGGALTALWVVAPPWLKAAVMVAVRAVGAVIGQHPRKVAGILVLAMVFMKYSARWEEKKMKEEGAAVSSPTPPLSPSPSPKMNGLAHECSNSSGHTTAPKSSPSLPSAVDPVGERKSDLTEARIAELRAEWTAETAQLVAAATAEARRECAVEVDTAREEARAAIAQITKLKQVVVSMQDARITTKE